MKFPSLAGLAVVGACAAAASRLAVAPALGLLSTADAFGFVRPDPAVQVVAGVWTMTGVNVEDALANGDVIAASPRARSSSTACPRPTVVASRTAKHSSTSPTASRA
jgi:hypothetical protein